MGCGSSLGWGSDDKNSTRHMEEYPEPNKTYSPKAAANKPIIKQNSKFDKPRRGSEPGNLQVDGNGRRAISFRGEASGDFGERMSYRNGRRAMSVGSGDFSSALEKEGTLSRGGGSGGGSGAFFRELISPRPASMDSQASRASTDRPGRLSTDKAVPVPPVPEEEMMEPPSTATPVEIMAAPAEEPTRSHAS